jgi:L-lactate dehydrogenase complex protein LldG
MDEVQSPSPSVPESPSFLIDAFIKQCDQTLANVCIVQDIPQAARLITNLIKKKDVRNIVLWDHLITQKLMESIPRDQQLEFLVWNPSRFKHQHSEDQRKEQLSRMDLGLTAADFGLADTGSIALFAGEGQDPVISLLPPIHVALLVEDQILGGMGDLLDRILHDPSLQSRTFNLISGPSRTGDIELTMSLGVHGPKEVHIIILKDGTSGQRA